MGLCWGPHPPHVWDPLQPHNLQVVSDFQIPSSGAMQGKKVVLTTDPGAAASPVDPQ